MNSLRSFSRSLIGRLSLLSVLTTLLLGLAAAPAAAATSGPFPTSSFQSVALGRMYSSTFRVPILMYHLVNPVVSNAIPDLVVDPAAFDAQLKALHAAGWHTITAARLGAAARNPRIRIAPKTFVITIDDGHEDGYAYAYPILRKYGFVATYYVITDRINHHGYLSWDQLALMASNGMEIGNHTVVHADVRLYHGAALAAQIDGAATAIEGQLALRGVFVRVTTLAYPYGKTTKEAHDFLKAQGYTLALTEVMGSLTNKSDPLYAPRVRVSRGETVKAVLASMR